MKLRALLDALSIAAPAPAAGDRWTLSSGQPVCTVVEGLNNDQPIALVIELSSLVLLPSIPALLDHRTGCDYRTGESGGELYGAVVLGAWDDPQIETIDGLDRLTVAPRWLQLPPSPENGWDTYNVECKGRSKIRPEGGAKQGHQGGVAARAA